MKFLFVGLGGIGQRHLRNLVQLRGEKDEIYAYRVRRAEFVLDNKLNVISEAGLEDKYKIKTLNNLDEAEKLDIDCLYAIQPVCIWMFYCGRLKITYIFLWKSQYQIMLQTLTN